MPGQIILSEADYIDSIVKSYCMNLVNSLLKIYLIENEIEIVYSLFESNYPISIKKASFLKDFQVKLQLITFLFLSSYIHSYNFVYSSFTYSNLFLFIFVWLWSYYSMLKSSSSFYSCAPFCLYS